MLMVHWVERSLLTKKEGVSDGKRCLMMASNSADDDGEDAQRARREDV